MSGESNSAYPLVLHTDADPSTLGGIAVCGFSTVGSVGVIAASHLMRSLDLSPMGTVMHPKFPAIALIRDSVPKHPVRVYQANDWEYSPPRYSFLQNMTPISVRLFWNGSPKEVSRGST